MDNVSATILNSRSNGYGS